MSFNNSLYIVLFFYIYVGTPLLALTGTADVDTKKTIITDLVMKHPVKLFVSPNRVNLRLCVNKVSRKDMLKQLDWLIDMIRQHGKETPKTIIFCDTMYSIASVWNYLMMSLGENAFHPTTSKKREHCVLGIFHSLSLKEYKERLLISFKNDGLKRVALATAALSMGVNFPNVRYIVNFGPARSLLDFHQQAGRAGRDGLPSDIILYFYGQQLSHCDDDVRAFLKSTGCHRVSSYLSFDPDIVPLSPSHECCNYCAMYCTCDTSNGCNGPKKLFEKSPSVQLGMMPDHPCRSVSDEQKAVLNDALLEVQRNVSCGSGSGAFGATHGFSQELISDVVANCDKLFTIEDIKTSVPVFSKNHAVTILEIINEIFNDIDESTLTDTENNFDDDFIFAGLDELFGSNYDDYTPAEDFALDPDALPE